jgi:hypothetical protein
MGPSWYNISEYVHTPQVQLLPDASFNAECHYAECRYAECRDTKFISWLYILTK